MTEIVDLSELLSDSPADAGISYGKFVVISRGKKTWLVLGVRSDYPYHAMLVAAFCDRESLPCRWEQRPDVVRIDHDFTTVDGGGMFELNGETGTLSLTGESRAYGPVRRRDLESLRRSIGGLTKLTLVVDS